MGKLPLKIDAWAVVRQTAAVCVFLSMLSVANASLVTQSLSDGSTAVFDDSSNTYWIPVLGGYQWTMSNVNAGIASLNSADYFGLNDWHLASGAQVDSLIATNGGAAVASNFVPDFQTSGTASYGITGQSCVPVIGCLTICYVGPCGTTDYTANHFYGIYDATTTLQTTVPDQSPLCTLLGVCNPTVENDPAHYATDLVATQYANGDPTTYSIGSDISVDNGSGIADTTALYGAWIVGTSEGNPSSVPEPGTLSLLGIGLAGIGFMRRRKAA